MVHALGHYLIALGAAQFDQVSADQWEQAAAVARMDAVYLQRLAARHKGRFEGEWHRSLLRRQSRLTIGSPEKQAELMLAAQDELETASLRLSIARRICAKALASGKLSLEKKQLWTDLDLAGTDLRGADLRGADISGSELIDARLNGAKIDDQTKLDYVNWWNADFRSEDGEIDKALLERLFERYGKDAPTDLDTVHPSCREFLRRIRS
jgi:hypothetical protein